MPPRPFPLPLSIGTDICQISRISRILEGRLASRFVQRVLVPAERRREPLRTVLAAAAPTPSATEPRKPASQVSRDQLLRAAQYLAGRFAAKEAIIKAHPSLRLGFQDIRITPREAPEEDSLGGEEVDQLSGPPVAVITVGNTRGGTPRGYEQEVLLSISHDGDYSTAMCLGFDQNRIPSQ